MKGHGQTPRGHVGARFSRQFCFNEAEKNANCVREEEKMSHMVLQSYVSEMDDFCFIFPAKRKRTVSRNKRSREKPSAHCCRDVLKDKKIKNSRRYIGLRRGE